MSPTLSDLPEREGSRPRTTHINPHRQIDQHGDPALAASLIRSVGGWRGVRLAPSVIAGEGVGFALDQASAGPDPDAFFFSSTEFAHLHADTDGSLHAKLPAADVAIVVDKGWGELHPLAARMGGAKTNVMLYAPRSEAECAVLLRILSRSYAYATTGS